MQRRRRLPRAHAGLLPLRRRHLHGPPDRRLVGERRTAPWCAIPIRHATSARRSIRTRSPPSATPTITARRATRASVRRSTAGPRTQGRPRLCSLAPEAGPCDAFIPRYYYDPETDRCSLFIWGGCQGNDNNFESAADCAQACDASPLPLAACEVGGVLFPSGTRGIDDPIELQHLRLRRRRAHELHRCPLPRGLSRAGKPSAPVACAAAR